MAHEDPAQRYEEQQWDSQHHRETRSDPQSHPHEDQINTTQRQQIHSGRLVASFKALH